MFSSYKSRFALVLYYHASFIWMMRTTKRDLKDYKKDSTVPQSPIREKRFNFTYNLNIKILKWKANTFWTKIHRRYPNRCLNISFLYFKQIFKTLSLKKKKNWQTILFQCIRNLQPQDGHNDSITVNMETAQKSVIETTGTQNHVF